jgi:mono/diheme cytochrome c family protein
MRLSVRVLISGHLGHALPRPLEVCMTFDIRKLWAGAALVSSLAGCFANGPGEPNKGSQGGSGAEATGGASGGKNAAGTPGGGVPAAPECRTSVETSEYLPARHAVISAQVAPTERKVLVSDMFSRFNAYCGGCHVSSDQGGFRVTEEDFFTTVTATTLERIRSADPTKQMPPPPDKPYSERSPGDPVAALASDIELWIANGSKPGGFYAPLDGAKQTYAMTAELGETLSNIGNCLPNRSLFATEEESMRELDDLFQSLEAVPFDEEAPALPEDLIGLPKTLSETDLFTLDSEVLARHGVIAFAPGYPLWSDHAGKLRHVRVPAGQTIRFNAERQTFEIPANTRFYKTFLKEVTDDQGEKRFRKIETRIIVSRPDIVDENGKRETASLFGVYKWDDTETRAELVGAEGVGGPFRNGRPFADLLFPYLIDEQRAQQIVAEQGNDEYFDEEYAFDQAGIRRHYAIPSSQRCIECHTGSPNESFVLGFTPLQIHRRPCSKEDPASCAAAGLIEPTGPDELTQLQRLVDVGLISGIDSADEITLLEQPQGERAPRNEHELLAQGYLLGNCSHCHNPNGFASDSAPELTEALDFLPRPDGGGIFQFPLERFSQRNARGPEGQTRLPYITPSLRDLLPVGLTQNYPYTTKFWRTQNVVLDESGKVISTVTTDRHMAAPWRSLIFRNTHAPYTYADDFAFFPRMPLNTPGFDCRANRLLGDWMVSIPSVRKREDLDENFVGKDGRTDTAAVPDPLIDREPQPYVEVRPGEPRFEQAQQKALARLAQWREGATYNNCPDTSDIIDPKVVPGSRDTPIDEEKLAADGELGSEEQLLDRDGVPDHAHWVSSDLTEPRGAWTPRNNEWPAYLIAGVTKDPGGGPGSAGDIRAHDARILRKILTKVTLAPVREFLETAFPMTLWVPKPGCDLSSQRKVSEFTGVSRPLWMDTAGVRTGFVMKNPIPTAPPIPTLPPADAAVYSQLPGALIFDMTCRNCHGRAADSGGPLAKAILDMTGGVGRVANFRSGLFGPTEAPNANQNRVFGSDAIATLFPQGKPAACVGPSPGATCWPEDAPWPVGAQDWAARYMAWMGLGGTEVKLPQAALDLVGRSDVGGFTRGASGSGDANMLSLAATVCSSVLGASYNSGLRSIPAGNLNGSSLRGFVLSPGGALIEEIGDAELWLALCSLDNPPPIRAIASGSLIGQLFDPLSYPAGAPIGNHLRATVPYEQPTSVLASNLFPYCYGAGSSPELQPRCPENLRRLRTYDNNAEGAANDEVKAWVLRGAVNAGLSVFVFLDLMSRGDPRGRLIRYDECDRIGN